MRLRSRQVSCKIGSIPAATSRAAAAVVLMWAWALAPSVTLTASASPRNGSALAVRSSGLQDTGGTTSAVMTKRPAARRCTKVPTGGDNGCDDIKVPGPDLDMEDGRCVLIYTGAMRVVVLCARRDCAMPELAGQRAQTTIWLHADTCACLCGHPHDPRLKGSAQNWKRVRRRLASEGGQRRDLRAVPAGKGPRWARFALPTLRCFRYKPRRTHVAHPGRADAGQVGLHERRQRYPGGFSQLLCGQRS